MKSTLSERVLEALAGPPKKTQKALAEACGINPVSVNDWVKGRTKTIEGVHLLKAAAFLAVNARWLGDGVGPKHSASPDALRPAMLAEPRAHYRGPKPPPSKFEDRHEVTESDWALLQDIKDAMSSPRLAKRVEEIRTELAELKEFAEGVMKKRDNKI